MQDKIKIAKFLFDNGLSKEEICKKLKISEKTFYFYKSKWTKRDYHTNPKNLKYHSPEYLKWREAVLERDGRKCVICGSTKTLQADHVLSYAYHPELRFNVDNGRTLCQHCHRTKTKTFGRKAKNLKRQI